MIFQDIFNMTYSALSLWRHSHNIYNLDAPLQAFEVCIKFLTCIVGDPIFRTTARIQEQITVSLA